MREDNQEGIPKTRLQTLYEVSVLFDNNCSKCPNLFATHLCGACPVEAELKEHRVSLGWVAGDGKTPWSDSDDQVLIEGYRQRTAPNIAKELDRTTVAVYARTDYLRKKGLL